MDSGSRRQWTRTPPATRSRQAPPTPGSRRGRGGREANGEGRGGHIKGGQWAWARGGRGAPRNQWGRVGQGARAASQWGGGPGRSRCAAGGRLWPRWALYRNRFESRYPRPAGDEVSGAETRSLLSAEPAWAATPTNGCELGLPWGPRRTCTLPVAGSAASGASAEIGGSGKGLPAPGLVGPDRRGLSRRGGCVPMAAGCRVYVWAPLGAWGRHPEEGAVPSAPGDWRGRKSCIWLMIRLVPGVGRGERRLGSGESSRVLLEGGWFPLWRGAGLDYPHPRNAWPAGRAGHRRAGRLP